MRLYYKSKLSKQDLKNLVSLKRDEERPNSISSNPKEQFSFRFIFFVALFIIIIDVYSFYLLIEKVSKHQYKHG